jgi:methyltransferase (TIGR00027 family)
VRDAVARGAKQLVILGAGYDGRAWRMPELKDIDVFEVDHPSTQAHKEARAAELQSPFGNVKFVSVDFTIDNLSMKLDAAGHDSSMPTCWIWEGVVMYLTRDAMRDTLSNIARRSARGSTLIINYHMVNRRFLASMLFRLIGEPQISAWTPDEMAADLKASHFRVREDSGITDWNARFANEKANVQRAAYMRIVVAENA